ncbi:hypothetical protein, partial [Mesorhizobium sp. M2E.F.Ca.ET.154.01.1.1]
MRKRHLLLLALLVAVAAVAALKAYGRATPEPAAQAPARAATLTVSVETVGSRAVTSSVSATGTISAWQEATIGAEESSLRLTAVLVK